MVARSSGKGTEPTMYRTDQYPAVCSPMTMDNPPAHTDVKNYRRLSLDSLTALTALHTLNGTLDLDLKKSASAFTTMAHDPISSSDVTR